ncbi:MAG: type II secretion system protein, partial [Acidimicrobiia bacterium]|nr:type II secretion system protein [Acidimicrobiia bacterium]
MNAQDDSGFSLIELIITIGLLGLASSAILGAMFMGMQTVDDTSTRFVNANNRNFSTKYVIPDVQAWDAAKSA